MAIAKPRLPFTPPPRLPFTPKARLPFTPPAPPKPDISSDILDKLNIGRHTDRPRYRYLDFGRGGSGRGRGGRGNGRRSRNHTTTPLTRPKPVDPDIHSNVDKTAGKTTPKVIVEEDKASTKKPDPDHDRHGGGDPDTDHVHGEDGDDYHGEDDDHDHNSDHEGFSCEPTSSQHSKYIQENLERLQEKCNKFHACTMELYNSENFHRVLAGENIQLKNICGLMYANGGGEYTVLNNECSSTEREAIRQDIGRRLTTIIADPSEEDVDVNSWRQLNRCLRKDPASPSEPAIDAICRMKRNSMFLCNDHKLDGLTEEFFNHEMEHLHCSCSAIQAQAKGAAGASAIPPWRYAVAGGVVGLLLLLIIVVVVLCIRHRKVKRALKKHRMQYLPNPLDEATAIYQEINDHPQSLEALRKERDQANLPGYHFLGRPPSLPDRYVKDLSHSRSNMAARAEGDPEYLEPLPDPAMTKRGLPELPGLSNVGYVAHNAVPGGGGKGDGTYELAKNPGNASPTEGIIHPKESAYFERVNRPRADSADEDGGYSTLGRRSSAKLPACEASEEETQPLTRETGPGGGEVTSPEEPKYFVLESDSEAATEKEALTTVTQL